MCTCLHFEKNLIKNLLPKSHFSETLIMSAGFFPINTPIQILAWRSVLHTFPPQSCTTSESLSLGGSLLGDINRGGMLDKKS